MSKLKQEIFICVDCETTGLDVENDQVIEVAAARFTFDEVLDSVEWLIDPKCPIPEESTAIHHITQEMVTGQATIDEVLPELIKFMGRTPIVGHGVAFDIKLIDLAAKKHKIPCLINNSPVIDTLRLARLYGNSPINSLEELRKHFNIAEEGAHRALADVKVNIEVFKQLCSNFQDTKQILKRLEKPIALKTMPLGKHKGRLLKNVPLPYLQWSARQNFDQDLLFSLRSEINRRKQGQQFSQVGNPFQQL